MVLLLEPFLDTEFDDDHTNQTIRLLEENNLTPQETQTIRQQPETKMINHTVFSWEWQYYGLYDVLYVMKPKPPLPGQKNWQAFYKTAMDIAGRGKYIP